MLKDKIEELQELVEEYKILENAVTLFHWDQSTGAPSGGGSLRGKCIGKLSGKSFQIITSDKMNDLIYFLDEKKEELDEITKASVRDLKKFYESFKMIPVKEMEEYSNFISTSGMVWEEAKQKNNFDLFAPQLEKMISYKKKFVLYRGYKINPYNTWLDDFEEGMTTEKLDVFFNKLKQIILPLLQKINNSKFKFDSTFLKRYVPIEKQKQFSNYLVNILGFDLYRGMLKESEHPFTTNFNCNDVRITTHYYENDVLSSMYSVIHEIGHALYEQNIDPKLNDTYVGSGVSTSIHESQSRFYENIIGRSKEFWKLIFPEFINIFKDEFGDLTYEDFYLASNMIRPNLIRIEADELTYSLHVLIRYEIEKEIFNNNLSAYDIREIWNKKYFEYIGIIPDTDSKGILQDVHWSEGYIGYFPSYSLGNAYASMMKHYLDKDFNMEEAILKGDIKLITNWMKEKIHKHGSLIKPNDLIKMNFNEDFNADYYCNYLDEKFTKIYSL